MAEDHHLPSGTATGSTHDEDEDEDFHRSSVLRGAPLKVVWLRITPRKP
jgi:hypothetical protein